MKKIIERLEAINDKSVEKRIKMSLGLGPDYVPKKPNKYKCPKCGENSAIIKEIHPDTDMNEIVGYCKDCGYESEDTKKFMKV